LPNHFGGNLRNTIVMKILFLRNRKIIALGIIIISVLIILCLYVKPFSKPVISYGYVEYAGCRAKYEQSSDDYRKYNKEASWGSRTNNEINIYDAKQEMVKCLCDKYAKTKDKVLEKYIIDYCKNDSFFISLDYTNCIDNVIVVNAPVDSLCKYKNDIFLQPEDSVIIRMCNEYECNSDQKLGMEIQQYYKDRPNSAVNKYACLLDKKYGIFESFKYNIDSICKYKDLIFKSAKIFANKPTTYILTKPKAHKS